MKLITCPLCCGQCFTSINNLRMHLEEKLKNIKCPYCFLLIDNVNDFPSHLEECGIKKEATSDEEEYEAEVISVDFDDVMLGEEVTQEPTENNENFQTEEVIEDGGNVVVSSAEQEVTSETENSSGNDLYHCSICEIRFVNVQEHLKEYHNNQVIYLESPEGEEEYGTKNLPKKEEEDAGVHLEEDEDRGHDKQREEELELSNMPTVDNDDNDQAIWINWDSVYYLSVRSPSHPKFDASHAHDLGYFLRAKLKHCSVSDLSPFFMEDEYGDRFFSVPVDTAIDYFEASHGRCGPKRFNGVFTKRCVKIITKHLTHGRIRRIKVYERIISTSQLSLTQILFAKKASDSFVPVLEQINVNDGNDEGNKHKLYWKCSHCSAEMDSWEHHDCGDQEELYVGLERYESKNKENDDVTNEYGVPNGKTITSDSSFDKTSDQLSNDPKPPKKYVCKACNIIFFKDKYFFNHIKEKHPTLGNKRSLYPKHNKEIVIGKYYCEPCKLMFVNEKWLLKHHQTIHNRSEIPKRQKNPEAEVPVEQRTCTQCDNLVFDSLEWFKEHNTMFHGDNPSMKYSKKRSFTLHMFSESVTIEEDEIVADDAILEPKILRTCTICVKVKNSIESLRKHLKEVHNDESIGVEETVEEGDSEVMADEQNALGDQTGPRTRSKCRVVSKNSLTLVEPVNPKVSTVISEENTSTTNTVYQKPLYKFKNDGLSLIDVQKRYVECCVIEIDFSSNEDSKCIVCSADGLETSSKFLRHMEMKHIHDICLESYFLLKRKFFKERKKRKIDMFNSSTDQVCIADEDGDQSDLGDLNIGTNNENNTISITITEPLESDTAVDNLASEDYEEDVDDPDSMEQPPTKKTKYDLIKADNLPDSVRKKLDEQIKSTENTEIMQNTNELKMECEETVQEPEDRTSKLTIEVMDYLNYKEKLENRLNKKAALVNETKKTIKHSSVRDYTGDSTKSCMTCKVTFSTERWLERHKEIFHKNCSECPVCFLLIQDHIMDVHMKGHSLSNDSGYSIEFVCKECNNSFESEEHLNYHKQVHQNRVMVIQKERCPHCTEEFIDADMLKNHLKVHSTRRVYTCNYCHKHFFILAEKVVHERIHTGVKPFACDVCGKAFRKKFSMTMHMRHVHLNDRRYQCNICLAKFVTNSSLIVHTQRHDLTPRFKCKLCPKLFTNTGSRANHVRRQHYGTVEYVCKHCTRIFYGMSALKKHYSKHESNELKYGCMHCPQTYGRSLFLNKHLKEVHGDFVE